METEYGLFLIGRTWWGYLGSPANAPAVAKAISYVTLVTFGFSYLPTTHRIYFIEQSNPDGACRRQRLMHLIGTLHSQPQG